MLRRSTIFLGLMLTGSLAAAALVGGEGAQPGEVVAPVISGTSRHIADEAPALPALKLDRLARTDEAVPEQDPFAGKSWYVPPPPPPPSPKIQETPKPTAPPLPFAYMGRMQEEGAQAVVYLTQGARAHSVSQGDTIDRTYRLESISPTQLVLTYLPLGIRQTLSIGSAAPPGMGHMASADDALPGNAPDAPPGPETGTLTQ